MNFKSLTQQFLCLTATTLGTLLVNNLAVISAEVKPKNKDTIVLKDKLSKIKPQNNLIDPTSSTVNISGDLQPFNSLDYSWSSLDHFSLERPTNVSLSLTSNSEDVFNQNLNQEPTKSNSTENIINASLNQSDIESNKLSSTSTQILEILELRFGDLPDSILEQVNQVSDISRLNQLRQIAEVSLSLERFQQALNSSVDQNKESSVNSQATLWQESELNPNKTSNLLLESSEESLLIAQKLSQSQENEASSEEAAKAEELIILGAFLSQLNGSPYVFGTPSTVIGSFTENTQLTGDWGGSRLALAEQGIFFDIYATTVSQGLVSGGNDRGTDPSFTQNIDAYLNVVNLWPGAILHAAFQSKIGNSLDRAGTLSPTYYGTTFPLVDSGDYGLFTEYYLVQALSPQVQLIIGKANATNFADTNVFANQRRYQFQNAALNNNLMLGSYVPPSTWLAGLVLEPAKWLKIITAVGDPNGSAENFADDFFNDVTIAQEFDFSYKINQQPGNFRVGWVYSSIEETNFDSPLNITSDGVLDFRDPIQTTDGTFMVFLNFDQYLFTVKPHTESEQQARQFYTPRGLGIFGRFGIGSSESNFISRFYSLGIGAKGIIRGREDDQFGLGWYYLDIADGFQDEFNNSPILSAFIGKDLEDESGIELYYNYAITPAMQINLSGQYIFTPFLSQDNQDIFILGGRLQINF